MMTKVTELAKELGEKLAEVKEQLGWHGVAQVLDKFAGGDGEGRLQKVVRAVAEATEKDRK
jgi:hypothetical protein